MQERRIFTTADGSHSISLGDSDLTYHSRHGAVQESRHVFIEAGLFFRASTLNSLKILEIGFGTGLNAFMTLLEATRRNWTIHYDTYELYPLSPEQVRLLNYPEILEATSCQEAWEQLHDCPWEQLMTWSPHFHFQKHRQAFQEIDARDQYDLIYFDPFAPEADPPSWGKPFLEQMYRALRQEGVLTTYCAKGVVKRTLKSIGFTVETLPGPPGKREMTRAIK